ncbi:MAG: hypothetical protein Q7S22_02255 [Candidatus Micrarchaeota archaeon]|nr:hypothetical protein [Candidatus Micrarchaeota archaeon]
MNQLLSAVRLPVAEHGLAKCYWLTRDQTAQKKSLIADLRANPFRPIQPEELLLFQNPIGKSWRVQDPREVTITRDGYRILYTHTFFFTPIDEKLLLTIGEVGFALQTDGSVILTKAYQVLYEAMKNLLENGMARHYARCCEIWPDYISKYGFDPNDDTGQSIHEFVSINGGRPHSRNMLEPKDREIFPDGYDSFRYMSGFAVYPFAKLGEEKDAFHSHVMMHLRDSSYFPSIGDISSHNQIKSSILWMIIDPDFIHQTLGTNLPNEQKIKAIIDHHVKGMEKAICIGVSESIEIPTEPQLIPLVRAH